MYSLSNYINKHIKESIGDHLGRGAEGDVYDAGDGKVKKVFHRGQVPVAYQLLKAATEYGDIETLPKVYEVGDDYIIRENCTPGTPKCKKYWKVMASRLRIDDKRTLWQMVRDGELMNNDKTIRGITKEVIDWILHLKYELSQVCGPNAGLGDFAEKNLGETSNGRIVLMDF